MLDWFATLTVNSSLSRLKRCAPYFASGCTYSFWDLCACLCWSKLHEMEVSNPGLYLKMQRAIMEDMSERWSQKYVVREDESDERQQRYEMQLRDWERDSQDSKFNSQLFVAVLQKKHKHSKKQTSTRDFENTQADSELSFELVLSKVHRSMFKGAFNLHSSKGMILAESLREVFVDSGFYMNDRELENLLRDASQVKDLSQHLNLVDCLLRLLSTNHEVPSPLTRRKPFWPWQSPLPWLPSPPQMYRSTARFLIRSIGFVLLNSIRSKVRDYVCWFLSFCPG